MHCYCFAGLERYKKKRDRSLKWGERKTGSERLRRVQGIERHGIDKGSMYIHLLGTLRQEADSGRRWDSVTIGLV